MIYDLKKGESDTASADKGMKEVLDNINIHAAYKASRSDWEIGARKDVAFFNGNQWDEGAAREVRRQKQNPYSINVTKPGIELLVSQLTANRPRFISSPVEDSDLGVADKFAKLLERIWYISKGNVKLKTGIRDYEVVGIGALGAYIDKDADYGKGEIFIRDIDPFNLYIDPNSKDPQSQDASHILESIVLTGEQVQDMYPDISVEELKTIERVTEDNTTSGLDSNENQVQSNTNDVFHYKYRVIDRYSKIKVKTFHVYDPLSNYEKILTEEEYKTYATRPAIIEIRGDQINYYTDSSEVYTKSQLFDKGKGVYHYIIDQQGNTTPVPGAEQGLPGEIPNSTTLVQKVTVTELLNEGVIKYKIIYLTRIKRVLTLGRKLIYKDILPIENYPIVTFMLHHDRKPYPQGDVRIVRPLNEQLNKTESLIVAHASNATNVKVFISKGSINKKQLEEDFGKAGAAVFEVDMELGAPVIVQPVPLPNELYKNKADKTNEIERILGAYAFQDGSAGQAPQTAKGTLLIDEMGQRRQKSKKDDIEESINQLAKVIVEMIPKVYTTRKVIRLTDPNNEEVGEEFVINDKDPNADKIINDVTVGKYDVMVLSGSMMPTNRSAQLDILMTAYQQGILTDKKPIIMKLGLENTKEILKREDTITQLQGQLQQAEGQIKQLSGDLQSAQRAQVQSGIKNEIMKTKTDLKDLTNKAESGVVIANTRMNDQVKNFKLIQDLNSKLPKNGTDKN